MENYEDNIRKYCYEEVSQKLNESVAEVAPNAVEDEVLIAADDRINDLVWFELQMPIDDNTRMCWCRDE